MLAGSNGLSSQKHARWMATTPLCSLIRLYFLGSIPIYTYSTRAQTRRLEGVCLRMQSDTRAPWLCEL